MQLKPVDVAHLLRRVGFGGTRGEIRHFVGREAADAVDEILSVVPPPPARPGWTSDPNPGQAYLDGQEWWLDRMADARWVRRRDDTPSPLVEKLALFWHSHFACGFRKVFDMHEMWLQNQRFRTHALGDYERLLTEAALSGAMLRYIDNESNVRTAPQENFARELMELHTMGVGNYTQSDVEAMARAWTGHNIVGFVGGRWDLTYRFYPGRHDNRPKTLFEITKNWDAPDTIHELVKGSKRPVTARFLVTKLWRFFVDDAPPPAAVDELAVVFASSGMELRPLIRALLLRPEFWAPETRWAVVRSPAEIFADVIKRTGIRADQAGVNRFMPSMGQDLFEPPNVAGWGTHGYWVSTGATWGKANLYRQLSFLPEVEARFAALRRPGMTRPRATRLVLHTMGVYHPSPQTRAMVGAWFDQTRAQWPWMLARNAVMAAGFTPEFQLA